jgi:chromate transport protein ChrA
VGAGAAVCQAVVYSIRGPAAHIAVMRYEVVERRGWLSEQEFPDYNGADFIVGPNSQRFDALFVGSGVDALRT